MRFSMKTSVVCILVSLLYVTTVHATLFRQLSDLDLAVESLTLLTSASVAPATSATVTSLVGPAVYNNSIEYPLYIKLVGTPRQDSALVYLTSSYAILTHASTGYVAVVNLVPKAGEQGTLGNDQAISFPYTGTYYVSLDLRLTNFQSTLISTAQLQAINGAWTQLEVTTVAPEPVLTSFAYNASQNLLCSGTTCTRDFSFDVSVPNVNYVYVYFYSSNPSSGVIFRADCEVEFGIPANCQGKLQSFAGNSAGSMFRTSFKVGDIVPKDTELSVAVGLESVEFVTAQSSRFFSTSALTSFAGAPQSITFPTGSDDVTPPVCQYAPWGERVTYFPEGIVNPTTAMEITCTDTGGVGVAHRGIFYQLSGSTTTYVASNNVANVLIPLPANTNTSVSIVGVFAFDYVGNAVLYGSCGPADGRAYIQTLCSGVLPTVEKLSDTSAAITAAAVSLLSIAVPIVMTLAFYV